MKLILSLLALAPLANGSAGFQLPVRNSAFTFVTGRSELLFQRANMDVNIPTKKGSTHLQCALLSSGVTRITSHISPPVRNSLILGAASVAIWKNRKVFYPSPDPNYNEPLPEGSLGCPLIGNMSYFTKMGDNESGAGKFFRWRAALSSNPRIFKFMAFGKPQVVISGMKNLKPVFLNENKKVKTGAMSKNFLKLFGGESLLFVSDPDRHRYLRRLVGQAITPEAIQSAMPLLIKSATDQIDKISLGNHIKMESTLQAFTLDVAWRVILGLDLREDEYQMFYDAVEAWIGGIIDPRVTMLPGMKYTKAGKAYNYLVSKIERKLESLETNGPDGSTLSGMLFAKDEEDPTKSLTKDEIISNSLLLILAGSETAASTLTVASLALGLNKDVFEKLKNEQFALLNKYPGEQLTRDMLEKCSYLDAVIKETMRIKPLATTGALRFAEETLVVDGKQIPKGWGVAFNPYLTHSLDPAVRQDDESHMDITRGFKPERWLKEETKPTEYLPFGLGPRFCLGYNLAMAEMKVFLALFVQRVVDYDMVAENVEWKKMSIIPKPKDGSLISVTSLSNLT